MKTIKKDECSYSFSNAIRTLVMVRETGLEPVRDYHTPLKRARLPIPPLSQVCSEPFLCSLRTLIIIAKAVCYVKPFFKVF